LTAMRRFTFKQLVLFVIAAVALIVYPYAVPSYYFTALLTQVLIFSIFTMALNLLAGYTGLPSLGHSALFGGGAYTAALLAHYVSKNIWLGYTAGILAAGILAALFALISLRTIQVYFLFITIALGQLVWAIVFGWRSLTRGDDGLPGIGNPVIWSSATLSGGIPYYYFALALFSIVLFILYRITTSPFGHVLVGIRENESRICHLGYNVWLYKFTAFVISGLLTGLGGVTWAYYNGFVNPRDASFELSAEALLIVILGGRGTLFGPLAGTVVVVLIKNIIAAFTQRWLFVLGVAYILTILYARGGIVGTLGLRLKKWAAAGGER
jgi:branched-chain amino acid transport system permease protein